jgi:CPA2 family monovalent cation:H+ antiporter-2
MHNIDLILTLTGGLATALIFGYITHRLGLSPIVGYLLAGVVVGPYTPGYVADQHISEQLAEIGVILLMFGVGLHFHLEELLAVRKVALPGAIAQSLTATILGALVARAFGWDWKAGIVFGMALSVASTVVLTRILTDNRDLHTPTGHIAIGWLVVEDLFTVFAIVMLPALFGPEQAGFGHLAWEFALAIIKISALLAFAFIVGVRVIPKLLDHAANTQSRELFTLTVLVVALGIAVGSAKLFGVSMALGAFLAGMVVGRSDYSLRAATEALPMRDAFAVLFFVSVGMLFDPSCLTQSPALIIATLAIILIGKPLIALVIIYWLRYPTKVALGVAISLAQIGEFSFLLAVMGREIGAIPAEAMNILVGASIVSITLNPILYRLVDPIDAWIARQPRLNAMLNGRGKGQVGENQSLPHEDRTDPRYRSVVIGYGPVGRTVARLLKENEIEPTIIEMNMDTVRRLREEGINTVYGDATHRDILRAAGAHEAGSLILSSAGMQGSEQVIRVARELNPDIRILARTAYLREVPILKKAGAEMAYSGEGEVALALAVAILRELGATPEQIDRERDRVQEDLFGAPRDRNLPTPQTQPGEEQTPSSSSNVAT